MKISSQLILCSFLLSLASLPAQASKPTLESNIDLCLRAEGLRSLVNLGGLSKNRFNVYVTPSAFNEDGTPVLLSLMQSHPHEWRETRGMMGLFDRLCHPGRWKSFHLMAHPSLHVLVYRELTAGGQYRYWFLMHFDEYAPAPNHILDTIKHMTLEVIPHRIFGTRTSQRVIRRDLDKEFGKDSAGEEDGQ